MKRSAVLLAAGIAGFSAGALAAPPVALEFTGRGAQVFSCAAKDGVYAWALLGPDAQMYDAAGNIAAKHFYGPSWQANDGSTIKGKVLVANAAPSGAKDAPWLVLQVISAEGPGIFAGVTTITRTATEGGAPPEAPCNAAASGQTVKVPYSARYTFFSAPN
jgi:hypothetical protein